MSRRLLTISASNSDDRSLLATVGQAGYEVTRWSLDMYVNTASIIDHADLIVVDLHLSPVAWFVELERRRQSSRGVPALVVLSGTDVQGRIEALDGGADDCLSRPFDPQELRARLNALARRHHEPKIRLGTFVWHSAHRQASIDSVPLALSPCETMLLEEFVKVPDRIVPTSTLARRIDRSDASGTLNRLYVYICRLRKKLAASRLEIRSASGLGYALDTRGIGLQADHQVERPVEVG